jgi:hypothetical protein
MENLHQYICGKSGSGKSTYLKNQILDEIEARDHAVFFIDPHGHDALDLLDAIPPDLTEKTCYIDLSDAEYAVGFNPLIKPAHTLSGLKSIWIDSWGPRMEWLLLNGLLVLAENPPATLEDLTPLYFDPVHREKLLRSVAKPATHKFWTKEFPLKYEKSRDNPDSPILNKIGQLLTSDISRNLCQKSPKFNFREALAENYIAIVNLSKPTIGDEAAAIFGSLFTTTLRTTLLEHPAACSLYADEFQTYGTSLFASMLSEMRKFGLKMVLAHQFISQIDEKLQKAILGNVSHKVIFNVDYDDAVVLSKAYNRLVQDFNPSVLTDLPPYSALIDGHVQQLPTFDPARRGRLDTIIERSHRRFGRRL